MKLGDADLTKSKKPAKKIIVLCLSTRLTKMEFCAGPHSIQEIMTHVGASNRSTFKRNYFDHLVETGRLEMTIKDKPTSSKQKYITAKGQAVTCSF